MIKTTLKQALKKQFPTTKFSVRAASSRSYNNVYVNWSGDLDYKTVLEFVKPFEKLDYCTFKDIWEVTNERDDLVQYDMILLNKSN